MHVTMLTAISATAPCPTLSVISNAAYKLLIRRICTLENKLVPVGGMGSIFQLKVNIAVTLIFMIFISTRQQLGLKVTR